MNKKDKNNTKKSHLKKPSLLEFLKYKGLKMQDVKPQKDDGSNFNEESDTDAASSSQKPVHKKYREEIDFEEYLKNKKP